MSSEEEQMLMEYHYYKALMQVLMESDLKFSLVQGRQLQTDLANSANVMPDHLKNNLLNFYLVNKIFE